MATTFGDTSPAWCLRLISELHAADDRATAVAESLTPRQLNWRPRPDAWSVGQCLDHLCVANEVYLGAISDSLVDRQHAAVQEITLRRASRWFIRNYIEPSSETRRARAPKKIAPAGETEPAVLDRFLASNGKARAVIHGARNYDVNRIRFKNPFIPLLRFTVGTGFEILSRHQRRHLLQAERIRASSDFPVD